MPESSDARKKSLKAQIDSAKSQVQVHRDRLAKSTDESQKAVLRGAIAGAENTVANLEYELRNA